MKVLGKIIQYQINDTIRSKWLFIFNAVFFAINFGIIKLSNDMAKAELGLLNVTILLIPLVAVIYGIIFYYNSQEYIITMLSQPIERKTLFTGLYLGIIIPFSAVLVIAMILPVILIGEIGVLLDGIYLLILLSAIILYMVFTGLALAIGTTNNNRMKGIGLSLVTWLFFSLIYDGIFILVLNYFKDYNLNDYLFFVVFLNPIDLSRITVILNLDYSAMMGYTGALFNKILGSYWGVFYSILVSLLWIVIPFLFSSKKFRNKDF